MEWEKARVWLHRAFFLALILVFLHEYPNNIVEAHNLVVDNQGCLVWDDSCPLVVADRLYNTAFARLSLVMLGLMVTDKAFLNAIRVLLWMFRAKPEDVKNDDPMIPVKFSFAYFYVFAVIVGFGVLIKYWRLIL